MISRARGFTLLEILVAFTVLSLVVLGTLEVFSGNLRSIGAGEDYTRAVSLARSKLDELMASYAVDDATGLSQREGETGDAAGAINYRWRIELEPYVDELMGEAETAVIETQIATVAIEWDHHRGTRRVALQTIVLGEPE